MHEKQAGAGLCQSQHQLVDYYTSSLEDLMALFTYYPATHPCRKSIHLKSPAVPPITTWLSLTPPL